MGIMEKALWYMEWRRNQGFDLDAVAEICGVSRFHLSRTFLAVTGTSPMAYARGRRLSESARRLAYGRDDILTVALDAGYGSHEAFSRAFRDEFGLTPRAIRASGGIDTLHLTESFAMTTDLKTSLEPPRFEDRPAFHVAGLARHYTFETNHSIPALWQEFAPHIGHIDSQIGDTSYGVCYGGDGQGNFDYMAGVEVSRPGDVASPLTVIEVPAAHYAVFTHRGHISGIRKTVGAIWQEWLPNSGRTYGESPDFELYDQRFDPTSDESEMEVWIPVLKD